MRRFLILVVLLIATATTVSAFPQGKLKIQAIPKVNEKIKFIVTTEFTNEPVANVEIWVTRVGTKETVEAVIQAITKGKVGELVGHTNQNGEFNYSFDDWGVYVIQAKKEGYISSITTVEVKPLGRLKVSTEKMGYICELPSEVLTEMTVDEVITSGKAICVMVRVTDEHGNPVKGAEVFVNLKSKGYTNENGELEIGLEQGVYLITAEKKGYLPAANITVTVTREDIEDKVKELIEEAKRKVEKRKEGVEELLKVLKIENPKVVGIKEEFEIKVTFKGEPVSDAMITITKHGIVIRTGKTDVNGVFRTSLDEKGVYVITTTKEGYRSGKSVVAVVPTFEVKPLIFVHIIPVIEPEKPGIVEVCKAFVKEIKIKVKNKVKDVIVKVKQLKELPKNITKPPGLVYVCIEINVTTEPDTVKEGEITFNVSKEWLAENNIDKTTVVLMKYVDGQWIPLETRMIEEDDQYVYYVAKTPTFSIYAITAGKAVISVEEKIPTEVPTETPMKTPVVGMTTEKGAPGFEAILGSMAVVTALGFALRKRL